MHLRALLVAGAVAGAVADDEPDQRALHQHEDRSREDRDPEVALFDALGVGRGRLDRGEAAVARDRSAGERKRPENDHCERPAHCVPFYERDQGAAQRNPRRAAQLGRAAVRGLRQRRLAARGADFRVEDDGLVFSRELHQEGKLGFWRWASITFGVAGTYRKNDVVDVIYEVGGRVRWRPPCPSSRAGQPARGLPPRAAGRRARRSADPARVATSSFRTARPACSSGPRCRGRARPGRESCTGRRVRRAPARSAPTVAVRQVAARNVSVSWVVV